jgi:tetratricopeptide (TPR) repeat protein
MRKLFFFLFIINLTIVKAQDYRRIDSLLQSLSLENIDTLKVLTLNRISRAYVFSKPDSANIFSLQAYEISKKQEYYRGIISSLINLWASNHVKGNYHKAIQLATEQLKILEKKGEYPSIAFCYSLLSSSYQDMNDYPNALRNALLSKKIEDSLGIETSRKYTNLGQIYGKMGQLDSAIRYANKGYETEYIINKGSWTWPAFVLGEVNSKLNNIDLALVYYKISKSLAIRNNIYKDILDNNNGIADIFRKLLLFDSVIFYSKDALKYQEKVTYTKGSLYAYENLAYAYKQKNLNDSSIKYYELSIRIKDSLFSQEKTMQIQNLANDEESRQKELEKEKAEKTEERKQNLQYAAIALGLIGFIILFFIFSHSIIANEKLIKFLGILSLLLVFEFINLFIHPYLARVTNHSTVWMLSIMVLIAAVLIPIHHRLEKWITHRMVEKNKRIRLESAKKTISELEGMQNPEKNN